MREAISAKADIFNVVSILLVRVFAAMQLHENLKIPFLNHLVDF